jgi:lambda repressor-like predicted transcriptional regulator
MSSTPSTLPRVGDFENLAAAARAAGLKPNTVRCRIKRGIPLEQALLPKLPPRPGAQNAQQLRDLAEQHGIRVDTLRRRLNRGVPLDKAVQSHRVEDKAREAPINRKFDPDQIRYLLVSGTPHRRLSIELGCSPWLIAQIRYGYRYADVLPELDRWLKPTDQDRNRLCSDCLHHRKARVLNGHGTSTNTVIRCGLGLPDVINEGPRFARFCNAFLSQSPETQTETEGLEVAA